MASFPSLTHLTDMRTVPSHIRDVERIWVLAALPQATNRFTRWVVPSLSTAALAVACFSPLWHPNYYIHQSTFWASHMVFILPTYMYLVRRRHAWGAQGFLDTVAAIAVPSTEPKAKPKDEEAGEHVGNTGTPKTANLQIRPLYRRITLAFYALYMAYWAYFCGFALYEHRADPWPLQIGNAYMAIAWYLFFAVASAVYFYTTILMLVRAADMKRHILALDEHTTKETFFRVYDDMYETNRRVANVWNRIIFLSLAVLSLNIPADLLAVFVRGAYFVIVGAIVKIFGIFWYLWCICKLNHMEEVLMAHLHRHHLLQDDFEELTRYLSVRPLGLNFFGVRITYSFVMKIALLGVNVLLPTVYGLISNNILAIA